jgi:SAM-dependent methyltransferase
MFTDHILQLFTAAKPRGLMAAAVTVRRTVGGTAPDRVRALRHYGAMAHDHELRTASGDQGGRELVLRLAPQRGEVILDIGCGTGRNFEHVMERIGPGGRLIGVEPSPEMIARAQALVDRRGWTNVDLICASAEDAEIAVTADAVLLCAVHDVMRSPVALGNVLDHLREGGRIVAGGPKWVSWRRRGAVALNLSTWRLNRECVSTFEGFVTPWSRLQPIIGELQIEERYGGGGYLATGVIGITPSEDAGGSASLQNPSYRG